MKLTFQLLKNTIHSESVKVVSQASKYIKKGALSDAGKAKIRYVGGMCVAKTRKPVCNILREKLGDPRKSAKEKVKTAEKQLNFIYSLDASYEEKKNASLEKTFEELKDGKTSRNV